MGIAPDGDGRENPNRRSFFSSLGLPYERVAGLAQFHSLDVVMAEGPFRRFPQGDGLVVADPSVFASVTVADCLPIYLLDRDTSAFALLHSGWKGTGIVLNALRMMATRLGTKPASVSAVFGPCIRACCYAVDEGRAAAFESAFGPFVRRGSGTVRIDLQAANARLLEGAGVSDLAVCEDCTFTDERLGSFRREGAGQFTRMAAVIGSLPEEKSQCRK
jgi:YfiH family protein